MSYIDETMRQIKKLRDDAVNVAVCETGGGIDFMEAERKLDAFIREKILESYRNGQLWLLKTSSAVKSLTFSGAPA